MTRSAEAALLLTASVIAAFGTALVGFTRGVGLDAQVALTFIVFVGAFGAVHLSLRRWAPSANPYLFPLAAILAAVGLTEVYRLDPELGSVQRWSLLIAAAAASAVIFFLRGDGVAALRRYRYLFLAFGVALLLLPLLPDAWPVHGIEANGSRLWVGFNFPGRTISFQPGEIAKLLLAVFLASYLADHHMAMGTTRGKIGRLALPPLRQFGPIFLAAGAAFAVLVYQRDLGASLLIFTLFVGAIYLATGQLAYIVAGGVLVAVGGLTAYQMFDHVQRRVSAWLDPFADFSDTGYQVAQGLFALGSGSLTGSGVGMGRPDLIPAAATDFIFAAVAEEMGFAGAVAVVAGFALLVAAGFGIALHTRDLFRRFLAACLTLVLAVQTLLILAGVLRLFPITGITLPFMSYGGTSLVANMVLLALLARISHGARA